MKFFTEKGFERRLAHEIEVRERDRFINERIDRLNERMYELENEIRNPRCSLGTDVHTVTPFNAESR